MKSKKTKRSSVAGLHLWAVIDQYEEYWITTRQCSVEKATRKGKSLASRLNSDSKVTEVKNCGTIDA